MEKIVIKSKLQYDFVNPSFIPDLFISERLVKLLESLGATGIEMFPSRMPEIFVE
jgi:hypothetical protein